MQHQIFSHKLLLKEKKLKRFVKAVLKCPPLFFFSFVILNFIIMRTKNLYGINNKSNGVRVVAVITRRPYCPRLTPYGFHCDAWRGKTKLFWSPGTISPPCDKAEVRTYTMTCVTNKLQMSPVQQFLPNLHYSSHNWPLRNAAKFGRHCDSQISYETSITLNTVPAQNSS